MLKVATTDGRSGLRDTSRVRVLVANDHAMVREGMVEMLPLNEDTEVFG